MTRKSPGSEKSNLGGWVRGGTWGRKNRQRSGLRRFLFQDFLRKLPAQKFHLAKKEPQKETLFLHRVLAHVFQAKSKKSQHVPRKNSSLPGHVISPRETWDVQKWPLVPAIVGLVLTIDFITKSGVVLTKQGENRIP